MNDSESTDSNEVLTTIRSLATAGDIHVTQHALGEMTNRSIFLQDIVEAVSSGELLEHYPEHQRGPCCLVNGTARGRPLHVVCTIAQPTLIIITAYEPRMPKWKTPRERNR